MKQTTTMKIQKGEDGPPTNSRVIHKVMLVVQVADMPDLTRCIGQFDDGYEGVAKQFCEWFNKQVEPKP